MTHEVKLPELGESLGRDFRVDSRLHQDGFSAVFGGTAIATGQRHMFRCFVTAEPAKWAAATERFVLRARRANLFRDPSIVEVFSVRQARGTWFAVTEWFDGLTLEQYLEQHGPMLLGDVVRLLTPCARALATAHSAGIVHGDVHASNMVVCMDPEGVRARLQNFGYGELIADAEPALRRDGMRTPGSDPKQADIYAFGVVLYLALTGRSSDVRANGSQQVAEIPPALADIVARALAIQPDQRFESFDQLAESLARVERGETARPRMQSIRATLHDMPAVTKLMTTNVGTSVRETPPPAREAPDAPCEVLVAPAGITRRRATGDLPSVQVDWDPAMSGPSGLWIRSAAEIATIDWLSTDDALDFEAASAGHGFWSRWYGHISLCVALIAFTVVAVEVVARMRVDSYRAGLHSRRATSVAMQTKAEVRAAMSAPQVAEPPTPHPIEPKPAAIVAPDLPPTAAARERPAAAHHAPARTSAPENAATPASRPDAAPERAAPTRVSKPLDGMGIL